MKGTKIFIACSLLLASTQVFAAQTTGLLQEVDCASSPVFTANGCMANDKANFQCFEAGSVKAGEPIT